MSLVIAIKGAEGLVLATDSRTVYRPAGSTNRLGLQYATRDDTVKLYTFPAPHSGVATAFYCAGDIDMAALVAQVGGALPQRVAVREYARSLRAAVSAATAASFKGTFFVAGFDSDASTGRLFSFTTDDVEPIEQHEDAVGMSWGGQRSSIDRLIQGFDSEVASTIYEAYDRDSVASSLSMYIPLHAMTLKQCVAFAKFLVDFTALAQFFRVGCAGVGGPVDIATITAHEGAQFVSRKDSHEMPYAWHVIGPPTPTAAISTPEDLLAPATYTHPRSK